MDIGGLIGTGSSAQTSGLLSSDAQTRANVTRDDFLKILVTEIRNQDPMDPLDNAEFLNQLSMLENIEAVSALADGIRNMQNMQNLVTASSLIGRTVRGIGGEEGLVAGIVTGAMVTADGTVDLVLDGMYSLALENVTDMKYTVVPSDVEDSGQQDTEE
ncbi:MAG: flagellar hook assembly protein FlgD [Planctomycetota bacterium]|jgi:flagellar basal-body rod modification protein FlgD